MDQFEQKVLRLPLATQPGTEWRYSISMDVLGLVIQRVMGRPFEEVSSRESSSDPI